MSSPDEQTNWKDDLRIEMREALNPVIQELREVRNELTSLKLSSVNRTDVYDKPVMDEKLAGLRAEIEQIHSDIKANGDRSWKILGAVGTAIMLAVYILPHLFWH